MSRATWIVLAAALSLSPACGSEEATATPTNQPRARPPASVRVAKVTQGPIRHRIEVVGEVRARRSVEVASRIAGRISKIQVELGDDVERGSTLVQLDDGPLRALAAEAQSAWGVAKAGVARAEAEHSAAEAELRRKAPLAEDELVTALEMDNVKARHDSARAGLEVAKAQVAQAAAHLKRLRQDLADTRLTAPFAGRIAARHLDPGAVVSPGTPILELVHTDPAVVRFQLGERQVGLVRPLMGPDGLDVELTLSAYGERRWTGRLVRLAPALRADSRAAEAEAEFANPTSDLMPGMFGRIELDLGGDEGATLVPLAAVMTEAAERAGEADRTKVFVTRGGAAHQTWIRLGLEDGEVGEVLEGLSPGEVVVVEGQQRLREGQKIRVAEGRGPADAAPDGGGAKRR